MTRTYRTSDETIRIRDLVRTRADDHRAGVFRRSDLLDWDVDPDLIEVMLRRRWWVRLHHGVYADRDVVDGATSPQAAHLLQSAATIAAIAGPAHLFAASASVVHDAPFDRAVLGQVHVVRPLGLDSRALRRRVTARDRLEPAIIHQHALREEDVTVVRGLPVVSRPLAALSTAALSTPEWAVVTLDAACWQSPETLTTLEELLERWPRLRGIGTVRHVLPCVRTGAQTPLESLSRFRFLAHGLPEPELQAPLHDSDGLIGYVDMLWRELGVVGEADGAVKYTGRDVVLDEKVREDRIRALGYIVVRWTWDEILRDPQRVVARVLAAAALYRRVHRREA